MPSLLSAFISRHQFAIKPYDSYGTDRASTGCLFRYLEQFGYVKKKKKNTQWKIHRYKSTSLFQITVGYNQWCPRLHHKKRTSNSLNTHSTSHSLKKKRRKRGGWKRKWLISKKKKRGKGDKGERHNEKKTRRRRRGKKDGDRGERKKKKQMRKQWSQKERRKEKRRREV